MRKICIIAHLNDLSGANKSLVDLAKYLQGFYEVTVVAPREGLLSEELRKQNITCKIIFSGTWVYMRNEKKLKKLIKRVSNFFGEISYYHFFKKECFDLIHFNSSVYGCGAMAASKLEIPYTWHIRELAEENFKLTFFNKKRSVALINSSKKIITISQFMKEKLKDDFTERKIVVVYNGLKPSKNINNSIPSNFKLVIIGAIAEDKGQLDAVKAIKILKEKYNMDFRLYIVGPITDKEYFEVISNEITDEIKNSIIFTGYQKDVSKFRASEYIALICSKAEAFGRVTIEAMNSGQIIIGANSGATPEIITDGLNGFLYQTGNCESLADKIHCATVYKDKIKMLNAGYYTVENKFNINNTVNNIRSTFEDVFKEMGKI